MIRVLIFIDQDVAESPAVVLRHVGKELQHRNGGSNEVIEVKSIGLPQATLILRVRLREDTILRSLRTAREVVLIHQVILERRHAGGQGPRGVALGVEIEILDDHGHESLRVG